jgi:Protein of unknown function (DUF2817)
MDGCYSENYTEARTKFREAARSAGALVETFAHPERGPDGDELSTDTAWLGPATAARVLVSISGTHGVEGFFGSAAQIEWLRRAAGRPLPQDTAALHVHAINPYGFAWLRRTNEHNIDLNRNWIDFTQPLPENPAYEELSDDLCPTDWSSETQAQTGARLGAWIGRHGAAAYQAAVSSGQWRHPTGLFFGGHAPCWSRLTLSRIIEATLAGVERAHVIDFHTGLGPFGYAEPIISRPHTDPGFARTRAWIGAAAKSLYGDQSVSSEIKGDGMSVLPTLMPRAAVDVVGLECGIRPINEVALALRADAWLHAHGDPRSPAALPIKAMLRAAFHSDDTLWQGMALGQGLAVMQAAVAGLAAPSSTR